MISFHYLCKLRKLKNAGFAYIKQHDSLSTISENAFLQIFHVTTLKTWRSHDDDVYHTYFTSHSSRKRCLHRLSKKNKLCMFRSNEATSLIEKIKDDTVLLLLQRMTSSGDFVSAAQKYTNVSDVCNLDSPWLCLFLNNFVFNIAWIGLFYIVHRKSVPSYDIQRTYYFRNLFDSSVDGHSSNLFPYKQ